MGWNQNIPQPTDSLSQSQMDILGNFRALNALFTNGVQPVVKFPVQTVDPTTLAGQIAIYSKVDSVTTTQELFMRRVNNGAVVDMTASAQATNGWTYLPSGLLLKWGTGTTTQNALATQAFPTSGTTPVFNNLFMVTASQTFAASPTQNLLNNALAVGNFTTTNFQIFPRAIGLPNASVISFCYFAIGN
jgi:hypothetical protein